MKTCKTLSREVVFNQPPWLIVERHAVEFPDGRVICDWPWVITPDFVNVVAVTADGRIPCFRQTKYGVAGTTLGLVGGFVEPGEAPLSAAKRELLEETGYAASDWDPLGSFRCDPNRGMAVAHFFVASNAKLVSPPNGGDLEEQELLLLEPAELARSLEAGDIKVLPWVAAVALGLQRLKKLA